MRMVATQFALNVRTGKFLTDLRYYINIKCIKTNSVSNITLSILFFVGILYATNVSILWEFLVPETFQFAIFTVLIKCRRNATVKLRTPNHLGTVILPFHRKLKDPVLKWSETLLAGISWSERY